MRVWIVRTGYGYYIDPNKREFKAGWGARATFVCKSEFEKLFRMKLKRGERKQVDISVNLKPVKQL